MIFSYKYSIILFFFFLPLFLIFCPFLWLKKESHRRETRDCLYGVYVHVYVVPWPQYFELTGHFVQFISSSKVLILLVCRPHHFAAAKRDSSLKQFSIRNHNLTRIYTNIYVCIYAFSFFQCGGWYHFLSHLKLKYYYSFFC